VPHPRAASARKAFLYLLVDDFSRLIVHGAWMIEQQRARHSLPEAKSMQLSKPIRNREARVTELALGWM
jgi:hypothetical protein